ncbi:hypothetical protein LXL04_004936 [Taraxacum kok-saghyz]
MVSNILRYSNQFKSSSSSLEIKSLFFGRVYMVGFGNKLMALQSLSIRGVQRSWDAISRMLHFANEVKHLYMKVEFTGDFEALLRFPEIDFVDFFKSQS